jgi:imidazoleglycerol-phosphate dehydratase
MTTAPFFSPSLSRLYSARASPVPKSPARSKAAVAFPARQYGPSLRPSSLVMASAGVDGNGTPAASEDSTVGFSVLDICLLLHDVISTCFVPTYFTVVTGDLLPCFKISVSSRLGEVKRVTKETNVHVKINLDGTGVADCSTGIPFLDHMLDVSKS